MLPVILLPGPNPIIYRPSSHTASLNNILPLVVIMKEVNYSRVINQISTQKVNIIMWLWIEIISITTATECEFVSEFDQYFNSVSVGYGKKGIKT